MKTKPKQSGRRPAKQKASARRDVAGKPAAGKSAARRWPVNLDEFEAIARGRLTDLAYAYIAGGAADECTKARNTAAFAAIRLKPRMLVDVSRLGTRFELFGQSFDYPILLAPTAYHKLAHPEGECASARAAEQAGTVMVVSTLASTHFEVIAKSCAARLWFQLYINPDRGFTRDLVARVQAAGCKALCLTVDSPLFGTRDREVRVNFHLPDGVKAEHFYSVGGEKIGHVPIGDIFSPMVDPAVTWKDVEWLASTAKVPVLLKGILAPEDARMAADHGAQGIIVSNHGGRNLDTVPATIEALPRVVEAVGGRIPVLFDGGIRRGTDVLKALALGARAVFIGRPYFFALAVGGTDGVVEVLRILRDEFRAAMALCGTPSLAAITRDALWPD